MKRGVLQAAIVVLAMCARAEGANAQDRQNLKGRVGIGTLVSVVNTGIGPAVEYWATPQIAGTVAAGVASGYTTYGVRGTYLFHTSPEALENLFGVFRGSFAPGSKPLPYIAIGYSRLDPDEVSGIDPPSESGFEIVGGFQQLGLLGRPNIGIGVELGYAEILQIRGINGGAKVFWYFDPMF